VEKLQKNFALTPELIPGRNGVFDVRLDDEMIFSKHELGRFPEENEIVEIIKARTS